MSAEQYVVLASEVLAFAVASAASGAAPAGATHARMITTGLFCHVRQAAAPVAVATDSAVGPNSEFMMRVPAGNKIAAIQDTAGGNLSITWLQARAPGTDAGNYQPGLN